MYKWIIIPEGVLLSKIEWHKRKNKVSMYKTDKNVVIPYEYVSNTIEEAVKKWKKNYDNG